MQAMTLLLQWQNLIFLLPCALAALLLLLSSLHLSHHGAHGLHGHTGHTHAVVSSGHPTAHGGQAPTGQGHADISKTGPAAPTRHTAPAHDTHARSGAVKTQASEQKDRPDAAPVMTTNLTTNFILQLSGANRAPLVMILEMFCLVWGIGGYLANLALLHTVAPTPRQLLPSLLVALVAGLIGARFGAEILGRIMPRQESLDVSRDSLFGLTGTVAFPVSTTAGRIHVYDQHGTLHDEMCRVSVNRPNIERGRRAMVVDVDGHGLLVVEEVPSSVQ